MPLSSSTATASGRTERRSPRSNTRTRKVGDHWEPKDHPGPSDAQAEQKGKAARHQPRQTAGGVDANATKEHLLAQANGSTSAGAAG